MTNYYIKFYGNARELAIAIDTFETVCMLRFNVRPLKVYTHNGGRVVEYPATMKKFNEFYETALKRLQEERDFRGKIPRIVVPV